MNRRNQNLRRDRSQNILHLLVDREGGIDRRSYIHRRSCRNISVEFFKCITPNLTISNVKKPPNFIRKFSPDGKYLICFSRDQQSFENYKFLGTSNASHLLYKWKTEYVPPNTSNRLAEEIRHNIFDRLFEINWSIQLTSFMRPLYREFSIFTEDGDYVIVASYMPVQEENIPSYYTLSTINRMQFEYDLNWYRFYILKLSDGTVQDTLEYSYDFINLSHNHGVCLNGNMMAVVSMFHQWINIVQLNEGKFMQLFTIGRFIHGTDECMCSSVPEYRDDCVLLDTRYGGLKQKLLIAQYKNILKCTVPAHRQKMLQQFYRRFKTYQAMEIHKIQFIDADNLLIRYDIGKQKNSTSEIHEVSKLYAVYNITNNEIVNIFSEKSTDLLWLLTNFFDDFRNTRSIYTGRAPSSTSNNVQLQHAQMRLIESYPNGEIEAAYRLLPQLPISVQSFSISPYMDLNLFQYDDRLISALERPRYSSCEPVRFSDRETAVTKFRLYPGIPEQVDTENGNQSRFTSPKELVAYIFHPFEPIIISVNKLPNRYVTNVHIRNEGTVVEP